MELIEHYINLSVNDRSVKKKYLDQVWNILEYSYKKIGGLKGSGFSSAQDLLDNIPYWKLVRKNGKIIAVDLYKDKEGRKVVAMGSDGTDEGKEAVKKMLIDEHMAKLVIVF